MVLPGSAWAEKGGTVTNTDRGVLRMRPNADLPGNARRDFAILTALGRRLTDRPDEFDCDGPEAGFDELTRIAPIYEVMRYAGIGDGYQRWPFDADEGHGTVVLHAEAFAAGDRTVPLAVVDPVPPADGPGADELILTTGRVLQQSNSGALSRRSDRLTAMRGEDAPQIHPSDAAERGIEDGDRVTVSNGRGAVEVAAEVTPTVREGVAFCAFHCAEPSRTRSPATEARRPGTTERSPTPRSRLSVPEPPR